MSKNSKKENIVGPLDGVKVLNIGTSIVGPWAASILSHLGADAIKVERPTGEFIRRLHPMQNGISTCYTISNNDQLSSELDLKKPDQFKVAEKLGHSTDILIENFRTGVSDRIGLGYQALSKKNPGLVYTSSSSWGDVGPMRDQAALDPHVQAFSGFGGLNGKLNGTPEMLRFVHMDPAGAVVVANLSLLGLLGRERFGQACHLHTSHFAMGIAMQTNRAGEALLAGMPIELLGSASSASAPNQCFQMLDSEYIAIACDSQAQWEGLCRVLGNSDLTKDPRFLSNVDRVQNRQVLAEIVGEAIKQKPKRWWVVQLEREGVPHGFSMDFEQIQHHQQVVENGFISTLHSKHAGDMFTGSIPWDFSETMGVINPWLVEPGSDTQHIIDTGFGNQQTDFKQNQDEEFIAPLTGLKVIDATQGYTGPYVGLMLAEAGAEVIKIEPKGGDWARDLAPRTPTGSSALFESFNRNKDSKTIDWTSKDGQAQLKDLVKDADVFLEDWGPGVAEGYGFGYGTISKENPKLVYLALSAYGEKGPFRDRPTSELVIQGMTGYLRLLGNLGEPPVRVGADIVATCSGAIALTGILSALYFREKTGRGQRVATSLLGAMMFLRSHEWAAMTNPDEWLGDSYCTNETDAPHDGYQTKDRPVYMSPSPLLKREDFISMIRDLGVHDDLIQTPEYADNWWDTFGMGYLARETKPIWEKYTTQLTAQEVLGIVEKYEVWAVEFADLGALMDHPQVAAINLVHDVDGKRYVRAPWRTPWELPPLRQAPDLKD